MTPQARVGVVGGGILGTVLSLRLAQAGHRVTLLERGPNLGGLAGSMDFGGHTVDRFYHVITPADHRMIGLAEEVGLGDQLRFAPVGVGFYVGSSRRPMGSPTSRAFLRCRHSGACDSPGSWPNVSCVRATTGSSTSRSSAGCAATAETP